MSKYILTVTLNPAIDKNVTVPQFKVGHDFRETDLSISAGGKGINVSQVLAHLKSKTMATGFLGEVGANYITSQLDQAGIPHHFVLIPGSVRTSSTINDPVLNKITRVLERGPLVRKKDVALFLKQYRALLKKSFAVTLSGRSVPGVDHDFYAELIRIAKRQKVMTIFDTSGPAFPLGLNQKPFMVKPNLHEAQELLGRKIKTQGDMIQALKDIHARGISLVHLSDGSRGSYVFDGRSIFRATPPKIQRKSPVGCGDAYVAGFVSVYQKNQSLADCLRLASACGAANALNVDPGHIDVKKVRELFTNVQIRKIL